MPVSVNNQLLDRTIRHRVGLNRLSNGTIQRMLEPLDQADQAIANLIRGATLSDGTVSQHGLNYILRHTREINRASYVVAGKLLRKELRKLAVYEADHQQATILDVLPMSWEIVKPTKRMLHSFVTSEPFNGGLLSEWIRGMAVGKFTRIRQILRTGVAQRRSAQEIAFRIVGSPRTNYKDGITHTSRRSAAMTVRSAVTHVANKVRSAIYKANDDSVFWVCWVSVLESDTCDLCWELHGTIYEVDEVDIDGEPPIHPNCMCDLVPVIETADKLGLTHEELSGPKRALLDGKPPVVQSYSAWLLQQSSDLQNDILGDVQAQEFRQNKLKLNRFTDFSRKAFHLKDLKVAEAPVMKKLPAEPKVKPRKANFGWQPDLPDRRDHIYGVVHPKPVTIPPSVSLRGTIQTIFDQGAIGSCTANALCSATMLILKDQVHVLSRLDLYYAERVIEGTTKTDAGAELRDGLKVLQTRGVCRESIWPYRVTKYRQAPPAEATQDADLHKIGSYQRLHEIDNMKHCLANGFPFVGGFTAYASLEGPDLARTGVMVMPGIDETAIGGHAVMFVGYDSNFHSNPAFKVSGLAPEQVPQLMFEVQNSWGPMWGDAGHFWMPAPYMTDRNLSDDFWTMRAA